MILQALNDLYKRLADDADSGIPLRGFSRQPVPFALEIAPDGTLLGVIDLRVTAGKKLVARQLVVPEAIKRSGTKAPPNFIWDNTGYVLGADEKGKPDRAANAFEAFRDKAHKVLAGVDDEGAAAVLAFLDAWSPEKASGLKHWDELSGQNVVFKLSTERVFVHERRKVCEAWLKHYFAGTSKTLGQCLVTGKADQPIARLHADLKGVRGAQSKGATLVGFNLRAFESYGKEFLQGENAPVSEEAAFNYTTALNDLLKRDSRQKVQIGDATTVFWTEKKSVSESLLPFVFSQAEDQGDLQKLRLFLEALREGKLSDEIKEEEKLRFHVLGLSPNAGRISVRFWHMDTVGGMWNKVRRHFDDLRIVKRFDKEPDFPPHWLLLKAASLREDLDNLSPLLSGALMRSILTGAAYPGGLLSAVMGRIRAEQEVTYARAALVKACLVRNARLRGETSEVITVSLDESSKHPAYLLGRLFAVLEKLQQEAIPGANATIKDRYFGSASATPRAVFPVLLRLSQHHISKIEYGRTYDKRIQDILSGLDIADGGFPAHLSLEEQGLFALGYYHQRKELWTSKKDAAAKTETANTTPTED